MKNIEENKCVIWVILISIIMLVAWCIVDIVITIVSFLD